jgi:hypothetical protein
VTRLFLRHAKSAPRGFAAPTPLLRSSGPGETYEVSRIAEDVFSSEVGSSPAPAFAADAPWGPPTPLFLAPSTMPLVVDVVSTLHRKARRAKKK